MIPLADRFWSKVAKGAPDECWPWKAGFDRDGYGRFLSRTAHRTAYRLAKGDPGKLLVCHSCDNPPCCNPAHLWLGTAKANGVDSSLKKRAANGVSGQLATHCINGHEYTPENTYWRPGKVAGRDCRACIRERVANYKSRNKTMVAA